jgi:hypothetical protein
MTVIEFLNDIPADRQAAMQAIHQLITTNDTSVIPMVKPMMGAEMILYEDCGHMKYGLASTKKHMSLHCLPIYISVALHTKYAALLTQATFQKGCINFTTLAEMPADIVAAFIQECSIVSMQDFMDSRKKKK